MEHEISFGNTSEGVRVLLVEDAPGDATLIERRLARADTSALPAPVELTHVRSLTEATEALSQGAGYHVVLLDLGLPESHGLETLERLLRHVSREPVVVLTGIADDELAHNAVAAGADDFLSKDGLTSQTLVRTLRYSIDRAARNRELHIKTDAIDFAELAMVLREERGTTRSNIYVNRAFEKLSGYSAADMANLDVEELFDEEHHEGEVEDVQSAIAAGEKVRFETMMETKDGKRFWVSVGVAPVAESPGDMRHILFTFEDVSARHEMLTRLADLDRMITLGTLSAAVAHEINNPLSFISGNVQFALHELERASGRAGDEAPSIDNAMEALRDAMDGSERVRVVVEDLRDLAGGNTPNSPSMKQPISVERAVKTSLSMITKPVEYRAELHSDVQQNLPEVLGDSAKLGQVVLNLVLNASQAIPRHQDDGRVDVRVREHAESVVIEVHDNGIGIDSETMERIFDPFFSTKPSQEGTGLGLAICMQTVTRMGGEMDVESEPGVGSTFRVTLPTAKRRRREWSEISDAALSESGEQY
jgi:PAS domain S-box-containing protein